MHKVIQVVGSTSSGKVSLIFILKLADEYTPSWILLHGDFISNNDDNEYCQRALFLFIYLFIYLFYLFCRVVSTIMQVKLLFLLIGLCAISWHKAIAENGQGMFYPSNPFLFSISYFGVFS